MIRLPKHEILRNEAEMDKAHTPVVSRVHLRWRGTKRGKASAAWHVVNASRSRY